MKAVLFFKRMPYNQDRPFVWMKPDKGADFVSAFCFLYSYQNSSLLLFRYCDRIIRSSEALGYFFPICLLRSVPSRLSPSASTESLVFLLLL